MYIDCYKLIVSNLTNINRYVSIFKEKTAKLISKQLIYPLSIPYSMGRRKSMIFTWLFNLHFGRLFAAGNGRRGLATSFDCKV